MGNVGNSAAKEIVFRLNNTDKVRRHAQIVEELPENVGSNRWLGKFEQDNQDYDIYSVPTIRMHTQFDYVAVKTPVNPPKRSGNLWSEDDIDKALGFINSNSAFKQEILSSLKGSDAKSIKNVIKKGYAEAFMQYDSDVTEQFLSIYEKVAKKYWK